MKEVAERRELCRHYLCDHKSVGKRLVVRRIEATLPFWCSIDLGQIECCRLHTKLVTLSEDEMTTSDVGGDTLVHGFSI